jgi:PAS domain S-box-containing protein
MGKINQMKRSDKQDSAHAKNLIEASKNPLVRISIADEIPGTREALLNSNGNIDRSEKSETEFFNYFMEPELAHKMFQEIFEKGSVIDSPLTIRHKNGKLTDVLFNGSVNRDGSGNVLESLTEARNIAEQKSTTELNLANKKLILQKEEKEKREEELVIANKELLFQNGEKEKRAGELVIANEELLFQNKEREKREEELVVANKELAYQNQEKEKRAEELVIANAELKYQNKEKENRANELVIANKELAYQNEEKEKRAEELIIADIELNFQIKLKEKRAKANRKLKEFSNSLKLASQYARSLIEASTDPLVTISAKGKITDVNEALIKVTGVSRDKLIGTDFSDYFTEPDKARKGYKTAFEKSEVANYPLTIRHKNGKLTDVLYNVSVYKNEKEKVLGVFAAARDVTEQNRISAELIEAKLHAELATQIAEDAKRKAEGAVKAKQQFLSNMSHEIRTPMNAIIGFTKVVLKTDLTEKQDEYLQAIKMSGDTLITLINDILDLAKAESGKMTFEQAPFRMASSISYITGVFETKILEKNLVLVQEYDTNIPEILVGDSVRLHQIILNLVSNAVKFTNQGKITVGVRLLNDEEKNVTLEFEVADTGIGISKNNLKAIFENFQKASITTSKLYGGTGLGLAIVKQLIVSQGGSVAVTSKIGVGSTFRFSLQFQKTKPNFDYTKYLEENGMIDLENYRENIKIKNIKVLVVEDIALNQLLMRTLLEDFGFEFDIAANGKIAIDFLKTNTYDIILMDLQMPIMNGFEASEYIRKEMKSDIPIIALTADVTTVDLAKCREVGMNDYLAKPVDERLLYTKMVGLVNKPVRVIELNEVENDLMKHSTYIDLNYLKGRTKSNSALMLQIIALYLDQTPLLIHEIKQALRAKDWDSLKSAAHRMIPSFAIMGISKDYEDMANNLQEYARNQENLDEIPELVLRLEKVCAMVYKELEIEANNLKNTTHE